MLRFSALVFKVAFVKNIFLIALIVAATLYVEARRHRDIALSSDLTEKVNKLLDEVVNLHEVLVDFPKDTARSNSQLSLISKKVQASMNSISSQNAQKVHLQKVFPLVLINIGIAKESFGELKKQALSGFFRSVVEIVRTYKVNKHRIFFCSKDKNIWLQSTKRRQSWKAFNPINQEQYKNCGTSVR